MKRLFYALSLVVSACGSNGSETSSLDIVGGTRVSANDVIVKSTVALVSPQGDQFCTGSLISSTHVVTASHCLDDLPWSRIYVAFGTRATPSSLSSSRVRSVLKMQMNENYNRIAMEQDEATSPPNDIALVTLASPAPSGYAPIPMLGTSEALQIGEQLILSGFGVTRYDAHSSGVLYKVTTNLTKLATSAREIHFGGNPGHSACMGDSGGPAFVKRNGKLVLVGVTSRGSSLCDEEGIYTDVRFFRDWLSTAQGR